MRILVTSALAVLAVGAGILCFTGRTVKAAEDQPSIVASINVTNAQVLPEDSALVRAFIATGSKSVKCLATMNETTFVSFGTQVFCGQRDSATYGPGILITISYSQNIPANYGTSLTVWQDGAKYYGQPIMCEAAGAGAC